MPALARLARTVHVKLAWFGLVNGQGKIGHGLGVQGVDEPIHDHQRLAHNRLGRNGRQRRQSTERRGPEAVLVLQLTAIRRRRVAAAHNGVSIP